MELCIPIELDSISGGSGSIKPNVQANQRLPTDLDKIKLDRLAGMLGAQPRKNIARANKVGFATILYFIGTDHSALSVARVAQRVALGGHDVPTDRVEAR